MASLPAVCVDEEGADDDDDDDDVDGDDGDDGDVEELP